MRRLTAGPWVGEFGWELMSWQGLVRRAAERYEEVWVCGPAGHEALYADLRMQYIPINPVGTKDCWRITPDPSFDYASTMNMLRKWNGDLLVPHGCVPMTGQAFIPFGNPKNLTEDERFDVVVHARKPVGRWPNRAWPPDQWKKLLELLVAKNYKVAAIGTEAYMPAGARMYHANPLSKDMDLLAGARIAVGPSSGPMHLASLCKCPHVVWTDKQFFSAIWANNRERYEKVWNPLKTPCLVLDDQGWNPTPEHVFEAIQKGLDKWPRQA